MRMETMTRPEPLTWKGMTRSQRIWALRHPRVTRRHMAQVNNHDWPDRSMTPQLAKAAVKEAMGPRLTWTDVGAWGAVLTILIGSWAIVGGIVWLIWRALA